MPPALAPLLAAWQRVVYERPPPEPLRRGLVALPRAATAAVVLAAVTLLLAYALRERYRNDPSKKPPR